MNLKHFFVHDWKIQTNRITVISYRIAKKTEVIHHISKFCPICGKTVDSEKVIFTMDGNPSKKTLEAMAEYYKKQNGAKISNYGVF